MKSATYIIRALLLIVTVATPWFFGGVWADVQWILLLCLAVQLAFDLMSRFGQYDQPSWLPTAWLPVLFGIALGVCQLVPLSPSTAAWLAPETLALRTQLSTPATLDESTDMDESSEASLSTADAVTLPNFPRSINPAATREYLALLLLGAAVYVLASSHLVDRRSVTILFATVAICGAALAFFGLVQRLSWNGKFYWVFEPLSGSFQSFGPFVNRNNAGGFLNMCLATCLGLIVWVFWSGFQELQYVPVERQSSSRRSKRSRSSSSGRSSSSRSGRSSRRTRSSTGSSANRSTSPDSGLASPSSDAVADKADQYAAMLGHATSDSRDSDQIDSVSDHSEKTDQTTPIGNSDPNQETERLQDESEQPERRKRVRVRVKQRVRVHDQDDDDDVDLLEFRRRQKKIRKKFDADEDYEKAKKSLKLATPMAYGANVDPEAGSWIVRGAKATSRWIGEINALKLWSVVLAVCVAGGVFCTASRGSILALLVSLVVTAGMLAMRAGYRGYSIGILVTLFLGLGLMSWGGQTDFVVNRFEQMFDDNSLEQGRVPNWNEALRSVPDFWSFGTGLGTYRFVYERFQERFLRNTSHFHAENQFIQTMVEGGLLGTALLMLVLLLVGTSIFKLFQSGGAIDTALATMGTFALTSQIVGGTFDFGLYIPSNTILMAL
ncbi:MAG: O-antigen ligase family protein, partial [Planctomycetales bacterium]|nr:O-antigen ligase family protein [Planctomycetales bacterium]